MLWSYSFLSTTFLYQKVYFLSFFPELTIQQTRASYLTTLCIGLAPEVEVVVSSSVNHSQCFLIVDTQRPRTLQSLALSTTRMLGATSLCYATQILGFMLNFTEFKWNIHDNKSKGMLLIIISRYLNISITICYKLWFSNGAARHS